MIRFFGFALGLFCLPLVSGEDSVFTTAELAWLIKHESESSKARADFIRQIQTSHSKDSSCKVNVASAPDEKELESMRSEINNKLIQITLPQVNLSKATLEHVLDILQQKSMIHDGLETNFLSKGIRLIFHDHNRGGSLHKKSGTDDEGFDYASYKELKRTLSIQLKNVTLDSALKQITAKMGWKYQVTAWGVVVVDIESYH